MITVFTLKSVVGSDDTPRKGASMRFAGIEAVEAKFLPNLSGIRHDVGN